MLRRLLVIVFIVLWAPLSLHAQIDKTVTKHLNAGIKCVKAQDYEQSLVHFNNALEAAREAYPDSSMAVIACKSQLANSYFNLHDFETSLGLFQTVANFQKSAYGERSYEYASQLAHIAACYASLGSFQQAVDYCQQAVTIQEAYLDEDHLDYVFSLNSLAEYYSYNGQHKEAIETAKEVASIVGEAWGDDGEDYITSLEFLLERYVDAEDFSNARVLGQDILKRNVAFYGDKSIQYGQALSKMVPVYQHLDSLQTALQYARQAMAVYKNLGDEVHPYNYVDLYERFSDIYDELGDTKEFIASRKLVVYYEEHNPDNPTHLQQLANSYCILSYGYDKAGEVKNALVAAERAMEYAKQIDGFPNIYAQVCTRLAIAYSNVGQLDDAIRTTEEALFIIDKENLGEDDKLNCICNLSCLYDERRESSQSIKLGMQYLEGVRALYGEMSSEYAVALSNLGTFHCHAGNYSQAIQYGDQAISLLEKLNMKDYDAGYLYAHIANTLEQLGDYDRELHYLNKALQHFSFDSYPAEYATALDNISVTYCRMKDYSTALEYSLKAKEIRQGLNGENDPMYAHSLNNLAYFYNLVGQYDKALELDEKAVEIRKNLYGELSPLYIASLHNLAVDYDKLKMADKAIATDSTALNLALNVFEPDSPDIIYAYYQMADDYYQSGQYDKAVPYISHFFDLQSQNVISSLKGLNTKYKQSFWEKNLTRIERATHFAIQLADRPDMARTAFNSALMMKGLLLTSEQELERLLNEIQAPSLGVLVNEFKEIKNRLNTAINLSKAERAALYQRALDLEDRLLATSPALSTYTSSIESTWEDVRNSLQDKEVAVEFFLDDYYDYDTYCAMVIRKGWNEPKVEYICLKEYIDRLNSMGSQMFTGQITDLGYEGVWKPLEKFIKAGDRVYFATDGLMQQTNIELFGISTEGSITNSCDLVRLSSTRELCKKDAQSRLSSAVIYGGLTYDVDTLTLAQLHTRYPIENTSFSRGLQDADGTRAGWKYLPYTAKEADSICSLLNKGNISTTLFTREAGTEESFKALSGHNYSIVHIATHGFFLNDVDGRSDFYNRFSSTEDESIIDPMLRSGLIMSGGQAAWLGKEIPEGIDDGILLSKEISELDLSHIDAVVLSACDTGLGDVKNDGVFGLQRAFKLAGVKTILMSLWEIDDNITSVFMNSFYHNLLAGMSKHDAFKQAQTKLRINYTNPYYWAAFIMLD